jgi:hypothetical protein
LHHGFLVKNAACDFAPPILAGDSSAWEKLQDGVLIRLKFFKKESIITGEALRFHRFALLAACLARLPSFK